ncbi:hypothetical protein PN462_18965 [Spirulina sp. CS-785/01]|uniref:hypothetical protein n=1 Tax=Spirulina sp. CS-785/01 TaxID=3021716 RepID=UPI00232ECD76|nr:hypothetical protein [Spirulina sp. CS-785/01]MDB9315203.1 hypothetical protein [Spirulina sp. CS-785/01]
MTPNPAIMQSVEQLDYRVTVGDVATKAGLDVNTTQQGIIALASETGANLQVAESGDIAYLFPRNFRAILRNKYWKLRFKEAWEKIWNVLFYLIRISFGIFLIVSIVLIFVAIFIIIIALQSSSDDNEGGGDSGGGGFFFFPRFFFWPDFFWIFDPGYSYRDYSHSRQQKRQSNKKDMNFLEAVFSFLFGDGNPNADLDERRWQTIGAVIRNNQGAVIAEQIAPYMDQIDRISAEEENYMLPVLTRFNGYPEVTDTGEIVYYFPDLQVTANKQQKQPIPNYLREIPYRFSHAGSGQIMGAIGLGAVNITGALILGSLLRDGTIAAQIGGFVAFVASIYWILLAYGIAFLGIPLIRYFWIQNRNEKLNQRNAQREEWADQIAPPSPELQQKMSHARQFAQQKIIGEQDLAYSTERDLIEQELEQSDKIDQEWQRRLEEGS